MSKAIDPTEHLKVVAGNPTPEELAVVVAVLQAAAVAAASAAASSRAAKTSASKWHRNGAMLRSAITPGHGQWQASFRRGLN